MTALCDEQAKCKSLIFSQTSFAVVVFLNREPKWNFRMKFESSCGNPKCNLCLQKHPQNGNAYLSQSLPKSEQKMLNKCLQILTIHIGMIFEILQYRTQVIFSTYISNTDCFLLFRSHETKLFYELAILYEFGQIDLYKNNLQFLWKILNNFIKWEKVDKIKLNIPQWMTEQKSDWSYTNILCLWEGITIIIDMWMRVGNFIQICPISFVWKCMIIGKKHFIKWKRVDKTKQNKKNKTQNKIK